MSKNPGSSLEYLFFKCFLVFDISAKLIGEKQYKIFIYAK